MEVVRALTGKCVRQVTRQRSLRMLVILSTLVVFGSLYLMWWLSKGFTLHYLTSDAYNRMSFDVECIARNPEVTKGNKGKGNKKGMEAGTTSISCKPAKDLGGDPGVGNLSPTDILLNVIGTGNIMGDRSGGNVDKADSTHDFSVLLSNIVMNGFPLLGLDDYVGLSDFVSAKLGDQGRKSIMDYNGYKDRFGNFLNVRKNQLRLAGHPCLTDGFLHHLASHSKTLKELKVKVFETAAEALTYQDPDAPDQAIWAILELQADYDGGNSKQTPSAGQPVSRAECRQFLERESTRQAEWALTVRMHPSAIPDTRNFKWSPLKNGSSRLQSGQLLYFISGFLTLQLEMQNFLASVGKGGPVISNQVFQGQKNKVPQPSDAAQEIANAVLTASTQQELGAFVSNMTELQRPALSVPLYHRAFPTHSYTQQTYWHSFGSMIASVLVMFFCLPAAVCSGSFRREAEEGQLDALSTLPFVRAVNSAQAWMLCCAYWCGLSFLCSWLFFALVLRHSYSILPATSLLLCGIALGPASMCLGAMIKRADTLVVAVPTFVFVTMLPGLLYCDLAFDVQRSWWIEVLLCLLPASGAALVLREVCANEALLIAVTWGFTSSIAQTPIWAYVAVLLLDVVLYYLLAVQVVHLVQDQRGRGGGAVIAALRDWYAWASAAVVRDLQALRAVLTQLAGQGLVYIAISEEPEPHHLQRSSDGSWDEGASPELDEEDQGGVELSSSPKSRSRGRSRNGSGSFGLAADADEPSSSFSSDQDQSTSALRIQHLSASYQTGGVQVQVLSKVSAELRTGRVTLLLGSNGAGKTTMMKILAGLSSNFSGVVSMPEDEAAASPSSQESQGTRRRIGWCPQEDALFGCLSVQEHMRLYADLLSAGAALGSSGMLDAEAKVGLRPFSSSAALDLSDRVYIPPAASRDGADAPPASEGDCDISEALERLGMTPHAHTAASALSGGMKRRLSLALAMAGRPRVLLLDEPSSGCDSWTRELIRQHILSRKESSAVLVSTHHIDDVEVIADHVWFLNDRYLVFDGPISELTRREGLASPAVGSHQRTGPNEKQGWAGGEGGGVLSVQGDRHAHSRHRSRGPASAVEATTDPSQALSPDPFLELSSWDSQVQQQLLQHFAARGLRLHRATDAADMDRGNTHASGAAETAAEAEAGTHGRLETWRVPQGQLGELKAFLSGLEERGVLNWSLSSPSVFKALVGLYAPPAEEGAGAASQGGLLLPEEEQQAGLRETENKDAFIPQVPAPASASPSWWGQRGLAMEVASILRMRVAHLLSQLGPFLSTQVAIPFLIVLAVAVCCTDVSYPRAELSSRATDGAGEVLVAVGPRGAALQNAAASGKSSILQALSPSLSPTVPPSQAHRLLQRRGVESGASSEADPHDEYSGFDRLELLLGPSSSSSGSSRTSGVSSGTGSGGGLVWRGVESSDSLFQALYSEYYKHGARNRWGAFVVQDEVDRWVESTVRVRQSSLRVGAWAAFEELAKAGRASCSNVSTHQHVRAPRRPSSAPLAHSPSPPPSAKGGGLQRKALLSPSSHPFVAALFAPSPGSDQDGSQTLAETAICSAGQGAGGEAQRPSVIITLERERIDEHNNSSSSSSSNPPSREHGRGNSPGNSTAADLVLVIRSYQSLLANITMLSNVTTDHAAPVFLKEIAPRVFSSLRGVPTSPGSGDSSGDSVEQQRAAATPQYRLFSHPLPEVNLTNQVYIERGYVGAVMIVMYMLMTSITCVRFVAQSRASGAKTQMHLGGLSPLGFWLGNFLADAAVASLPLLAVGVAVALGGPPIREYFIPFPPFPFCLYLVSVAAYALAVVSSSYCLCVLSSDQLASQLTMLMSSLCCGVFLKLYLDRHNSEPFITASLVIHSISPAFAFSTCLFDMFKAHAVEVSVNVGLSASHRQLESCVGRIAAGVATMLLQAAAYLALAVLVDSRHASWSRAMLGLQSWLRLRVDACGRELTWREAFISPRRSPGAVGAEAEADWTTALSVWLGLQEAQGERSPLSASSSAHSYSSAPSPSAPPARPQQEEEEGGATSCSCPGVGAEAAAWMAALKACAEGQDEDEFDVNVDSSSGGASVDGAPTLMRAKALCVDYPSPAGRDPILALRSLSCSVARSERVALLGINGGGKSTLLHCLALAEKVASSGSLTLGALDAVEDEWLLGPRGVVGYVPQEGGLLAFLSVQQSVHLFEGLRAAAAASQGAAAGQAAEAEGYAQAQANPDGLRGIVPIKYQHYPVHALSGGNKKKLLVHLANVGAPRLLLLDECTTGVDPASAERLVDFLSSLDPSQGLVFSSHRIDECVRVCSRALMLHTGRKLFDGPMGAFDRLASIFYQVDVTLPPLPHTHALAAQPSLSFLSGAAAAVVEQLRASLASTQAMQRVVAYSFRLLRITLEKRGAPLTKTWDALLALRRRGVVESFSFRVMSSEEAIGGIIQANATTLQ